MEKIKASELFSKEWKEGFKAGLKVAQEVAKDQGYEIYIPDIDQIEVEKE